MRIDEFEFRNEQGQEIEPTKNQLVIYIKSLHKEIKELKKALELACKTMLVPDGYCEDKECPNIACKDCLREQFKTKAKEVLENE